MTALEAYALAKKIAISAVSGIKNLTINGTTLTIETNEGKSLDMVFPVPADGRGIASTKINEDNHLIVTYDDGTVEDAGVVKGSDVQVTQLLSEGIKIAKIKVDGVNTEIYAPEGGGSTDYFIIDEISSLPSDLTEEDRRIYFCIEDNKYHLWNGVKWNIINSGMQIKELTQEEYNALSPAEKLNGTIYFITDADGGNEGGNGDSYSLTEVKTNKTWINGKPIYRRIFQVVNALTVEPQNGEVNITENIDMTTDFISSVDYCMTARKLGSNSQKLNCVFGVGGLQVEALLNAVNLNAGMAFELEYTKN